MGGSLYRLFFVGLSSWVSPWMNSEAASRCPTQSPASTDMISSSNLALRGGDDGGILKPSALDNIRDKLRPHVDEKGCMHHVIEEALGARERGASDEPGPALVLVNYKLPRELLKTIWKRASIKICADGALNRLYYAFETDEERELYIPDYVRGDLDSVEGDIRNYYIAKGTQVVKYIDEDTTDLEKCLDLLKSLKLSFSQVIVMGAFGGRIDHEFSHYSVLYKYPETNIVLVSPKRAAMLLRAGSHAIHTNLLGPNCGLIPLGTPVRRVQTEGLKWDLHGQEMGMDGLISTSNRIKKEEVHVSCSDALLWVCDVSLPRASP